MKLSDLDKKILVLTQLNSRLSVHQVASLAGCRPHRARYVIESLLEAGVVTRYAFINPFSLGIIPIYDKERGKTTWVNTAFGSFSKKIAETFTIEREYLKEICKKNQINYLAMDTTQDIVGPLIDLFKYRNKRMKRG